MKSNALNYMPQLDGLRTVAVTLVFIAHFSAPRLADLLQWGELGVHLFFVLSGFLITGILLRCRASMERGEISRGFALRQFYIRRTLRIFPLYYATLLCATAIGFSGVRNTFWWQITYTSNVLHSFFQGPWGVTGHFWSLAVEEQFYLFWPWFIVLMPRRWLWPGILIATLSGPLFRLVALAVTGSALPRLLPACLDSLGAGALLAYAFTRRTTANPKSLTIFLKYGGVPFALGLVIVQLSWVRNHSAHWILVLGNTFNALFFSWLIGRGALGFAGIWKRCLESRPMLYLGRISYGLYVLHMFVLFALLRVMGPLNKSFHLNALQVVLMTGLSVALAALSWHFFEAPINRLKDRFVYKPTDALPVPGNTPT